MISSVVLLVHFSH